MNNGPSFRQVDRLLSLSSEDEALLATYDSFDDKGSPTRGYRLTILCANLSVGVEDTVRILHVCESVAETSPLYVMGPKPVWGEYVDDVLATEPPPKGSDPFVPTSYDGRVLPGPGKDTNYEVTRYRFTTPGAHTVHWRLEPNVSNVLRFTVT
jgi:hypothetical protein